MLLFNGGVELLLEGRVVAAGERDLVPDEERASRSLERAVE